MNSKLYSKRLELLSSIGEVVVTKQGNHMVILVSVQDTIHRKVNTRTVTKNCLHKLGTTASYTKKIETFVMVTTDNKLKFKVGIGRIVTLNHRHAYAFPNLKELFLWGRRAEFLKNEDTVFMLYFNFLKSFKTMKEVALFFGVRSNIEITPFILSNLMLGSQMKYKTPLFHVDTVVLEDTLEMARTLNYDITDNRKTIQNLHDYLVDLLIMQQAEDKATNVIESPQATKYIPKLVHLKDFTPYLTERDLFLAGRKFKNCISSRDSYLDTNLFFSATISDIPCIFQVGFDRVLEGKGVCNELVSEQIEFIQSLLNN